jgi:regulator of replication initiation timing
MTNLGNIIDQIGQLEAQKAKLEREVKAMKAALEELAPGKYEGERFALSISEFPVTTYDNEAIRAKCSAQLLKAHEITKQQRRLAVSVRKDVLAA